MKLSFLKIASLLILLATLHSCKKKPPVVPNPNEEFDRVTLDFIRLDNAGQQTTDTFTLSLNAQSVQTPTVLQLPANQSYRMLITLFANSVNVNSEIVDDADAHKFFFFPSPTSAVLAYSYNDGIGLDGKVQLSGLQAFDLNILLRHGLDKQHADAQAYNSPNYQNAGGDNDLNVTLKIQPQ